MRPFAETSFDAADAAAGAAQAFHAVHELWPEGAASQAQLQPLATAKIREALAAGLAQYTAGGLHCAFTTRLLRPPRVVAAGLLLESELGDGERPAGEAQSDAEKTVHGRPLPRGIPGPFFLSLSVRYDSEDETVLREGGPNGPVRRRSKDTRGHVWTFVRALPAALPAESLDSPWRVQMMA